MPKTRLEEAWNLFREKAASSYGQSRFQIAAGKHQLRRMFDNWWEILDKPVLDATDVEDAADDFLDITRMYFVSMPGAIRTEQERAVSYPLTSGSMQSVSAYAEALPIVLEARQDVLGSKEPLTREEAIRWLEKETNTPPIGRLVEVRFRFLVPGSIRPDRLSLGAMSGKAHEFLAFLERAATPSRVAPGIQEPFFTSRTRSVSRGQGESRRTIDLLPCGSRSVDALVFWAEELAGRCVGPMWTDSGDQPPGFEYAIWLILAGIWPRIATYGVLRTSRDSVHEQGGITYRRQAPCLTMTVLTLDMPPQKVADAYRRLRRRLQQSPPGPKMGAESEVLCLAALEAKEIDGLGWEDRAKFRATVLQRYSAKARLHGADPNRFTASSSSWNRARKVLRRAEAAYARLYPPSRIPVKSRDGPRELVGDEPRLFSKEQAVDWRLV